MHQQSENNDGAIFTSKDGKTEIWAYGLKKKGTKFQFVEIQ
jgi:hypothetical protein